MDFGTQHLLHIGQKFQDYRFGKPLMEIQRNRGAFQREDYKFPLVPNLFIPEFEKGGGLCTCCKHWQHQVHSLMPTSMTSTSWSNASSCKRPPDIFSIAAEHLKLAATLILNIMQYITNKCISDVKLPDNFKIGSICPMQKQTKPTKNPNNYWRITITALAGKCIEMHMMKYS